MQRQCQLRPELVAACIYLQRKQRVRRYENEPRGFGVLAELARFGRGE